MHDSPLSSVRGASCLDIGFHHMFSALDCDAIYYFVAAYAVCSGVSLCVYADASPGVGSLVGKELAQSLGARLLVSVLRRAGATHNLDYILFLYS